MIRNAVALTLLVVFAGALCADEINYYKKGAKYREIANHNSVEITGWSAAKVDFKGADGKTGSVPGTDIISVNRAYGTMHSDLSRAIESVGSDPEAAIPALKAIAASGKSPLDKEEALFWHALVYVNEANAGGNVGAAITELGNYLKAYKAGFFARDAYRMSADLQRRSKKVSDARTTLKTMISADNALAREGNQMLGELELSEKQYNDALRAFQAAKTQATRDGNKNAEYLAQAWEGTTQQAKGDSAAAKTLLEPITNNQDFDDPMSFDDELALSVAYPALGDAHYATGNFEKAYDAFVQAGYYAWWTQGQQEGYCIGQAYLCARKLESTDDKWKKRKDKLRTVLAVGFPRELQRVDKEK